MAKTPAAEDKDDPINAEDDSPSMEMVECEHCDGDGKMPDGSKCESCGGTGKVSQKAESDDAKPDADADGDDDGDKKKPAAEAEDEKEAKASLAALAGMKPSASLSAITAALTAKTVPLTAVLQLRTENRALMSRLEILEGDKHKATASEFVARAIADGRSVEDKRGHLEGEYAKAEKAKTGSGVAALEPQLFAKGTFTVGRRITSNGNPIGKSNEKPASVADGTDPRESLAAKIETTMMERKCTWDDARLAVRSAHPDLYTAGTVRS